MAGVQKYRTLDFSIVFLLAAAIWISDGLTIMGQQLAPPSRGLVNPAVEGFSPVEQQVVDVRVIGHRQISLRRILPHIHIRAGRPFRPEIVEEDVRRLNRSKMFVNVKTYLQPVDGGVVVIFELIERPSLAYVKYVGNQNIKKQTLAKEAKIKEGDSADQYTVDEARRRLLAFYHSHGYPKAQVTIHEGNQPNDQGVIFLINEGPKQKIFWTKFLGNTIATDARLRTQIQSKPGILWLFKGDVNRNQIDEDVDRLTAYYRSLGFFQATIGRQLDFDEDHEWLSLTFVINEGIRSRVRNVSFIGNTKFSSPELAKAVELKSGQYFKQYEMKKDLLAIQNKYGGEGYVFANVDVEPRFLEAPGTIDLVYDIQEGQRCRVGRINVAIAGEFPHTRLATVLNRMEFKPGDILDIRKLKKSEQRLKGSQLFEVDPSKGSPPKIAYSPPTDLPNVDSIANDPYRPPGFRGQSPDPVSRTTYRPTQPNATDCFVDLTIEGKWIGPTEPTVEPIPPSQASPSSRPPNRSTLPPPTSWHPQQNQQPTITRGQSPEPVRYRYRQRLPASMSLEQSTLPLQRHRSQSANTFSSDTFSSDTFSSRPAVSNTSDPQTPRSPWVVRGQYNSNAGYASPPPRLRTSFESVGSSPILPPPDAWSPPAMASYPETVNTPIFPNGLMQAQYVQNGRYPELNPLWGQPPSEDSLIYIPISPEVAEARTGRFMFSVGVNSDAGLLGSIIIDEQNFDLFRWPRSWYDIRNGTAFRGGGQRLRLEAVPGTEVQRYTITFQEPYLRDTNVSLGLSGFFYNRRFREWDEERLGGRISLGYNLTHNLSASVAFRGSRVSIYNPVLPGITDIDEAVGDNNLFGFAAKITHDTRDNSFLPTEGYLFEVGVEQVLGTYEYQRANIDFRKYFMLHQRPDLSGRHVLALSTKAGYTGEDTPVYEHFFAGGFSTLRGFDFRSASPRDQGILVGGHFQLLASAEYIFPLTADDMLRGVIFCDTGTVEPTINDWTDDYRVAPGFGLRITVPAMGPAPIALDFAFPISKEEGDDVQVFSFFVGFLR